MLKEIELPVKISLESWLNMKPGDECPDENCAGIIVEIVLSWTKGSFIADGVCDTYKDRWTLFEDFDFVSEEDEDG